MNNVHLPAYPEVLPTTSDLFHKHFGGSAYVGLLDKRVLGFFEELNAICKEEDRRKSVLEEANK